MKVSDAEIIRALTPISIALMGCTIALFIIWKAPKNDAGFGLASTAFAGAAGLAQSNKAPNE